MASHWRNSGLRVRALLAVLLVCAFGALSILSASHAHTHGHGHADGASHGSCPLCQASAHACEVPVPALAPAPAPVAVLPPGEDSPQALRTLPAAYESRGPPSA